MPKLYLQHYSVPTRVGKSKKKVTYAIIDGKQRLESIWGFMDDDFALDDDFEYYNDPDVKAGGLKYSELANRCPKLKNAFDSFSIPIICVETDDGELIQEMFSRLNEAVPLNAAEKRNALGGPMPEVIRRVARNQFFKFNVPFSDKRYQYREVSARLLFLESCLLKGTIVDTKREFLDEFVLSYKKERPGLANELKPESLRKSVTSVLSIMTKIFDKKDSLLQARASVVIYYLLVRSAHNASKLPSITRKKLIEFVEAVERNRDIAEKNLTQANFDLLEYSRMSIQGTNDASSIRDRLRIIAEYFKIPPDYGTKRPDVLPIQH
jgi:hypothetical protein